MKNIKMMKNDYIRTDLASECRARVGEKSENIDGISFSERREQGVTVSKLEVTNENGKNILGKPIGKYITIGFGKPWLMGEDEYNNVKREISSALEELIGASGGGKPIGEYSYLIVGLGNRNMTSDRVGPDSVGEISVTRHIKNGESSYFEKLGKPEISALVPGVYGETGIESAESVKKICELVKPDIVIAIDSLASRSPDRLMRTVQLCDSGISPGSGVNNSRKALGMDYLGVPVIAIGVPCVVDSSTLVYDALEKAGCGDNIPESLREVLNDGKNFFVSLKECDIASRELSHLISEAIDETLKVSAA